MSHTPMDVRQVEYLYRSNGARLLDNVSEDFHRRLRDKLLTKGYPGLRLSFAAILGHMSFSGTRLIDIAEFNGMTKQAISQIANEIESLGYIKRIPDPHDGRAKNVVFTELGIEMIQASIDAVNEVTEEYAALIGHEKMQQLDSILSELSDKLAPQPI
ncbi:MarR family winged helix-turn-helix transcriptional regulator [Oceanicoccus sp. KOV_DT_Chl]|uniref:MarR family winged helix-turn-helix transcriptional regulator n=1 Tax=Oceanicoccus sp. KOV_DT_Chl TaxID=1904639 RepID=UPI000C7CF463|nr:MarR family winged helix-turn-helix transcriptional regulator [Oceanicoccus sp. KOV_DT_Chl]